MPLTAEGERRIVWITLAAAGLAVLVLILGLMMPAATVCGTQEGSLLDCLRRELDTRVNTAAPGETLSPVAPAPASAPQSTAAPEPRAAPNPAPTPAPPALRPAVPPVTTPVPEPPALVVRAPVAPPAPAPARKPAALVPAVPPAAAPVPIVTPKAAPPGPVMPAPAPRIAIDAVEVDTGTAYIAGEGPAEASMRLYVNGTPVGDSTVTEGRWFVSGPGLLSAPRAELRVEARDSTGRIVGEGRLTIEMAAPPPPAPLKPLSEPDPRLPSLPSAAPLPQSEPLLRVPAVTAPVRQPVDARPAPEPALAVVPVVVQLAPSRVEPARRLSFGKAIIRPGDTLWGLARRYYGTGAAYGTIYRANRDLIDHPGRIFPGQVLEVPLVLDE